MGLPLPLWTFGGKANLDLLTGQVVDVVDEPVDQLEDGILCYRAAVPEVLNAKLVCIASFTKLHFIVDYVIKSFPGHRRNAYWVVTCLLYTSPSPRDS